MLNRRPHLLSLWSLLAAIVLSCASISGAHAAREPLAYADAPQAIITAAAPSARAVLPLGKKSLEPEREQPTALVSLVMVAAKPFAVAAPRLPVARITIPDPEYGDQRARAPPVR